MPIVEDDIYGQFAPTIGWTLLAVGSVALIVVLFYIYRFIRRRMALRAQSKVANPVKINAAQVIAATLEKIETFYHQASTNQISISNSAEQVSAVSREAFDTLMNHHTRYASRSENRKTNLETMARSQDIAYPLEFSQAPTSLDELRAYCDTSKEIVKSCS